MCVENCGSWSPFKCSLCGWWLQSYNGLDEMVHLCTVGQAVLLSKEQERYHFCTAFVETVWLVRDPFSLFMVDKVVCG